LLLRNIVVQVLIETPLRIANADAIAAIDGVGVSDLSVLGELIPLGVAT
jgi:2-keto-3-deoxy-L-rhamnonate aldolase RhmA